VSVTPAMGARIVAGEIFTLPILKDEGKARAVGGTDGAPLCMPSVPPSD
jgi:hypothetical protein